MNVKAALSYVDRIKKTRDRNYALRLFRYYRDYGTSEPSPWPHAQAADMPHSTVTRINNMIRAYMVGDCDTKGNRI